MQTAAGNSIAIEPSGNTAIFSHVAVLDAARRLADEHFGISNHLWRRLLFLFSWHDLAPVFPRTGEDAPAAEGGTGALID